MEKKPVNVNERIDQMSRALRHDPVAEAPEGVILKAMAAQPRVASPAGITFRISFAFALIGLIAFAMWPRESEANMLGRIMRALNSEPFVHTRVYKKNAKGEYVLEIERYQHGRDNRMIWHSLGGERTTLNGKCTVYYKSVPYALLEKPDPSPIVPDLERFLSMRPGAKLVGKDAVVWEGTPADRYLLEFQENVGDRIVDTKLALYVDPLTDRPLCLEVTLVGIDQTRWIWDYPRLDKKLLQPNVPKGIPIFDLDAQKKALIKTIWRGGDVREVGGLKVKLRAVIYDVASEELMVFTTGGEGRITLDARVLKVEGLPAGVRNPTPYSASHEVAMTAVEDGTDWKGLRLICEGVKFPKGTKIPGRFKLSVPVWKKDGSPVGRSFAGYAVFDVKNSIRTSRVNDLVFPQSMSIFEIATAGGWVK